MTIKALAPLLVAISISISGCAGISFTKAGEEDAKSACDEYANLQDDSLSMSDAMASMMMAETYAQAAADANDDYEALGSAAKAFSESMVVGSEDLAQSAWANVARICNDLF